MSQPLQTQVSDLIAQFTHEQFSPSFATDIISLQVDQQDHCINVQIQLPYHINSLTADLAEYLQAQLAQAVTVGFSFASSQPPCFKQVGNIILVASGKGGVGKSTTAVNLALALHQEGAKVGLLDADVYGPSMPLMLGMQGQRPTSKDGKIMEPLEAFGVKVNSIGFFDRLKIFTCNWSSNFWICMLNVGWVTKLWSAATVKFLYSATDKTYFNCVMVIVIVISDKYIKSINNNYS